MKTKIIAVLIVSVSLGVLSSKFRSKNRPVESRAKSPVASSIQAAPVNLQGLSAPTSKPVAIPKADSKLVMIYSSHEVEILQRQVTSLERDLRDKRVIAELNDESLPAPVRAQHFELIQELNRARVRLLNAKLVEIEKRSMVAAGSK